MADIADDLAENILAGTQRVAHLAQLVLALELHGNGQIALAEAHQSLLHLSGGLCDALDNLEGHHQHDNRRDNHHYNNSNQSNVGGHVLIFDNFVLLILQVLSQLGAGLSSLIQGGSTLTDDHLRRPEPVCPHNGGNLLGLCRPALQRIDKVVKQGAVGQFRRIGVLHILYPRAQLIQLGSNRGELVYIAGQSHVPQVTGGHVIVDPAVSNQRIGFDIVINDVFCIGILLDVHHNQRGDDDDSRDHNGGAETNDQALLNGHVLEVHDVFLPFSSRARAAWAS